MTQKSRLVLLFFAFIASTTLFGQGTGKKGPKEIAPAVQIYFDLNKSNLKKAEIAKLEKLIQDLKSKNEYRVLLTGHTDSLGNDAYNLELSGARVDEVYDWLIENGMDSAVLKKNYYGRSRPREGNEVEEKRAKNRRVEITIYEKEKVAPPPPPVVVVKDTCGRDTTIFIGQGIAMKMNICEYTARCQGNPMGCITIERMTSLDDIFNSGMPLGTSKGEGFMWSSIIKCGFKGDSCLQKPASISYTIDAETYKKARFTAQKAKNGSLEPDKNKKITVSKTKNKMTVTVPITCAGTTLVASNAGRSKVAKFKDKTGKIDQIYVVSADPVVIIPATKSGKFWYVNYKEVPDAKLIIVMKDEDVPPIMDLDTNTVRKTKKKGELRKKYKIKTKHLK